MSTVELDALLARQLQDDFDAEAEAAEEAAQDDSGEEGEEVPENIYGERLNENDEEEDEEEDDDEENEEDDDEVVHTSGVPAPSAADDNEHDVPWAQNRLRALMAGQYMPGQFGSGGPGEQALQALERRSNSSLTSESLPPASARVRRMLEEHNLTFFDPHGQSTATGLRDSIWAPDAPQDFPHHNSEMVPVTDPARRPLGPGLARDELGRIERTLLPQDRAPLRDSDIPDRRSATYYNCMFEILDRGIYRQPELRPRAVLNILARLPTAAEQFRFAYWLREQNYDTAVQIQHAFVTRRQVMRPRFIITIVKERIIYKHIVPNALIVAQAQQRVRPSQVTGGYYLFAPGTLF